MARSRALSPSSRSPSIRSARVGVGRWPQVARADADQAVALAAGCAASSARAASNRRGASCVGGKPRTRVRSLKSGVRSFSVTPPVDRSALLKPPRHASRKAAAGSRSSSRAIADVLVECRLGGDALASRARSTPCARRSRARAATAAGRRRRAAPAPRPRRCACKSPIEAKAEPLQPLPRRLADAPEPADAHRRQQRHRLVARNRRKAARLVEIGGELRQELAVAEADRDGDADLALDPRREPRQAPARPACRAPRSQPERSRNASSMESGSTSGVSARIMRANLPRDGGIFRHIRRKHDRVGQSLSARAIGMAERTPKVRAM